MTSTQMHSQARHTCHTLPSRQAHEPAMWRGATSTCICPQCCAEHVHTHTQASRTHAYARTDPSPVRALVSKRPSHAALPTPHGTHCCAFHECSVAPASRDRPRSGEMGYPSGTLLRLPSPQAEPGLAPLTDPAGTLGILSSPAGCRG